MAEHPDSFGARADLEAGGETYEIFRLEALQQKYDVARLPYSLKVLLENLLRHEDGQAVTAEDVEKVAKWDAKADPSEEIAYTPARVLMQDFTGVPAIVDLASMRDAIEDLGGEASQINPLVPAELVIDHSIQVDVYGEPKAFQRNAEFEFERNHERYAFLRWGQTAFDNFSVVPPNTGICHQVNLEYLGKVVYTRDGRAFPDTLVGTDSHTTMINGLGVLGWGVGGIEAEAAMLGQPISMLVPQVVGFRLTGALPEGATATDLVLTVTQMLRKKGVVGKFVEFFGEGLPNLPLADRATIGNMSPEYGATCGIFPVDKETLRYLEFSGRPPELIDLVEKYAREQGMFHDEESEEPTYSDTLELDLGEVVPSLAGPKRPQDRVALSDAADSFTEALKEFFEEDEDDSEQNEQDKASADSMPASDAPAAMAGATNEGMPGGNSDGSEAGRRRRRHRDQAAQQDRGRGGGRGLHAGPRRRGDRRDHELHQHLQPFGHARRGAPCQEGGGGRPREQAVGEDQPGAGLQGGDRVPRPRGPHGVPREARVRPRGLRLHHLHRELRARCPSTSRRRSTTTTWPWRRCCPATATSRAASTPR